MRLLELGRYIINLDARPTGLESRARLSAEEAAEVLAQLEAGDLKCWPVPADPSPAPCPRAGILRTRDVLRLHFPRRS